MSYRDQASSISGANRAVHLFPCTLPIAHTPLDARRAKGGNGASFACNHPAPCHCDIPGGSEGAPSAAASAGSAEEDKQQAVAAETAPAEPPGADSNSTDASAAPPAKPPSSECSPVAKPPLGVIPISVAGTAAAGDGSNSAPQPRVVGPSAVQPSLIQAYDELGGTDSPDSATPKSPNSNAECKGHPPPSR